MPERAMKTLAILCLSVAVLLVAITAGGQTDKPLRIVCSFLPVYIFTQNVAGDMAQKGDIQLECLLPSDVSPHDYALTPGDMKKISKANILFINGLGMEEFLEKAIKEANPNVKLIEISEGIKPMPTRGAEGEEEKIEEKHEEKGEGEHHHGKYNPHVWVSPKQAIDQVRNIQKALSETDPTNADTYKLNADKYIAKLQAIVDDLTKASKSFKKRKIVTFHDAFDYFARDFELEVVGVIEVVPGQKPSAGELSKMVRMVKAEGAAAIFSEPQYPEKISHVLAEETGVPVYQLDPVATGEMKPDTYEKAMRNNLKALRKALGK